ncbi:MAG: ferritin-like domain-containing protein [Pseudonocardiales bacterium]|nr:ferritin-like domain-containing protein [Pseudonocardiales bacterium]
MFGRRYAAAMINRSAENESDRRRFLRSAGLTGLGVVGAATVGPAVVSGLDPGMTHAEAVQADAQALSDASVLNFALNLEYLEAQFYRHAVTGTGLPDTLTGGTGRQGGVAGGHAVPFRSATLRQFAREIAADEVAHVTFLRAALGSAAVAQPAIDLQHSFTAAAQAAGIVKPGHSFDAFACEENFLLAAFLFEDVGVTAYKGASPLIQNKTYLEAAAGILATEAYHAANIRTSLFTTHSGVVGTGLFGRDLRQAAGKLSDARDSLDGPSDDDQGIVDAQGQANIVPTDANSIAYSRSAPNVLNIVYLTPQQASSGGFFPQGVNGDITTSNNNA